LGEDAAYLEDQLRREQRARSLLQWVARAAAESGSIDEALQAAIDEVCQRMEWPLGHVLLRQGDRALISTTIWHHEDRERFAEFRRITTAMSFPSGIGLPGRVLQTGRPLWISDVTHDENFPRGKLVGDLGVRAALAFPVLLGREVLAVLEFFSPDAAEPDLPLLEVMATIGTQLARVIERSRAEDALKQSEQRFRSVAETAKDAIITADARGSVVTWNHAAQSMFGHSEAEMRGQPLTLIIPERLRAKHSAGMKRIREGGEAHAIGRTIELDGLRRDGSEFPLELSLAGWQIGDERFFTGILRDISERRQQEQRLQKATCELARSERAAVEANRAKSLFLANMSHELRTPLNAILGFVQLMERDPSLSSQQREHLGVVSRSGEHLLGLINNVLSISKIEAGEASVNACDFSLRSLLESVRELFHARAESRGLTLAFDLDGELPERVHADEGKLRQVLINLVGNAVKFTDAGSVTVRVGWRDGRGRFEIDDTGPGIAPEDAERIMQPFVQAQAGTRAREGAGLGLAISRQFVRLLGGELELRSQPGRGTGFSFEIALPLATEPATRPPSSRRVRALAPDQPELRVLVVDNSEDNRRLMVSLLALVGVHVAEAADGKQAVEAWERLRPQLIWMDMRMPVLDGYQATRQIRSRERERGLARTLIIALTASAFEHDRPAILAAGCDDVVLKPFREAQIFDGLERWLGARFVYDTPAPEPAPTATLLSPARLASLPGASLAQLRRALDAGDDLLALETLDGLATHDAELTDELARMVRGFRLDELLSMLERVRP
jgi:PAS domain S-box-containing protein